MDKSAEETRIEVAINPGEPDRVPVAPLLESVAARWSGLSVQDYLNLPEKAFAVMDKAFEDLGGWDANWNVYFASNAGVMRRAGIMEVRLPGEHLPQDSQFQWVEKEAMPIEDYDSLIEKGYLNYLVSYMSRVHPGVTPDDVRVALLLRNDLLKQDVDRWNLRGIPTMVGTASALAFEVLSLMRSLNCFFLDLHRIPDKVERAIDVITTAFIVAAKNNVKLTGVRRAFVGGTRGSCAFVTPKQFERFVWPFLRRTVEELHKDNIVSILHFDSDWTLNLPYLRELPRGSFVLNLDSSTNIWEAKKALRDHACIMGDVPPALLSLGTPLQVTEYCKKLIDVVGEGGGFILSSGCEVPLDAPKQNVAAMVEAAKLFGKYR